MSVSALPEATKQSIQLLYRDFLTARSLKPRLGQKEMVAEVARVLSRIGDQGKPPIGFIEAETGTGKTLAYLIGALPVALEREMPLVISTATVSLQSQLIEKDLPDLAAATGLVFTWTLAKGRRRYLCPARLESAMDADSQGEALYPDELILVLDGSDRDQIAGLSQAWVTGQWKGDMDDYPEAISDPVRTAITTDHRRCQGRQCASFNQCPYFTARETWLAADVLVVNHDLLLSDLKLGGGVVLPPLEKTVLVVDEAHQLPRIAADQFTAQVRIAQCLGAIKSIERMAQSLLGLLPESHKIHKDLLRLGPSLVDLGHHIADWGRQTLDALGQLEADRFTSQGGGSRYRLSLDEQFPWPGPGLTDISESLTRLARVQEYLKGITESADEPIQSDQAETLANQWAIASARLEPLPHMARVFSTAAQDGGDARWIRVGQDIRYATPDDPTDIEFWASPITPAKSLRDILWGRVGAAILTSATLAHQGRFDSPGEALGIDGFSSRIVSGVFNYAQQGTLCVPDEAGDPRDESAHSQRVARYIANRQNSNLGVLVLFTSWRLLNLVEDLLSSSCLDQCLIQGQLPLAELLKLHQSRRAEGQTSILFGLQSMAEGIDLPGDLANEVVITRLPFQPPDDPREATYGEFLKRQGRDPFAELALPAATIRLRQAVGRLIRSETDTGQVTVLDRRLVNTAWGRSLLQALPSFHLED